MIRRLGKLSAAAGLVGLLSSCLAADEQMRFHTFASDGWTRTESVALQVDSVARSGLYDLTLLLRTAADRLPTDENVYLVVRECGLQLVPPLDDTLCVALRTEQTQRGAGGVAYRAVEVPVGRLPLRKGACGQLLVAHAMATDSLVGISELGYRLTPAEKWR